jgi:hypothetical protein
MFSGQLYRDGELLAIAKAFEVVAAPRDRRPPQFGSTPSA